MKYENRDKIELVQIIISTNLNVAKLYFSYF